MGRIQLKHLVLFVLGCSCSLVARGTDFFHALDQVTQKFVADYPYSDIRFEALELSPNLPQSLGPRLLYLLQKRLSTRPSESREEAPSSTHLSLALVQDDLILNGYIKDPDTQKILWIGRYQVRDLKRARDESDARNELILATSKRTRRFEGLLTSQVRSLVGQGSWITSIQPTFRILRVSGYGRKLIGGEIGTRVPVSYLRMQSEPLSESERAFRSLNIQAGFTHLWAIFGSAEDLRSFHHRLGFALGMDLNLPRFWSLYSRLIYEIRFSKTWVTTAMVAAHPIGAARSQTLSVRGVELGIGVGLGF